MKLLLPLVVIVGLATACTSSDPQATSAAAEPGAASAVPERADQSAPSPTATAPPVSPAPGAAPQSTASTPAASPAATASPAPAAPAPTPEPPAPKFREVTIPAGTALSVTVLSTLASDASKVEDPVKGALAQPVVVSGMTVLPKGAEISGVVTDAKESGRVKGKAALAMRFDRILVRGETYKIQTAQVTSEAQRNKGDDIKKGGVGAGLGAVVGGVIGGGKGAAIGAVAGGTGGVMATKGDEVKIEPGTVVSALLQQGLTVTVPIN